MSVKPAILVISSTVVRGAVGGRGAAFALERLGFPVWSAQTVTMPWHPGHGPSRRIIPDEAAFAALMEDLARAPWLGEIGGILTGYMGAAFQPALVAGLVDAVRAKNPDVLYLCDPVMGDAGKLYVPEATAAAIRGHLVPRADIITPNPTELGFLAGDMASERAALIEATKRTGVARVAITSAVGTPGELETLLVSQSGAISVTHAAIPGRIPNGTGDLFAALLLARLLEGKADREALRLATAGVVDAISAAAALGTDELPLAAVQDRLIDPVAEVRPIG